MRYLTLIPDYTQSCIKDDFIGEVTMESLCLPQEFIDDIKYWHEAYKSIIPLNESERDSLKDKIEELDLIGLNLAKKLIELVPGGAKVKYFSEGKLIYILVS